MSLAHMCIAVPEAMCLSLRRFLPAVVFAVLLAQSAWLGALQAQPLAETNQVPVVQEPNHVSGRVGMEVLTGSLMIAGGMGSLWLAAQDWDPCPETATTCHPGWNFYLGLHLFAVDFVLLPYIVQLTGDANGGDGSYWAALAYGFLGMLNLGSITNIALGGKESDASLPDELIFGILAGGMGAYLAGAIIGYELSSGTTGDGPVVMPTAALTSDRRGLTVGLTAAF